MSGRMHVMDDWIDDLILGRLLDPKDAVKLSAAQLEVIRAHIRSEILFAPEIRELLSQKARQIAKELE
jgi:hypothetical protein